MIKDKKKLGRSEKEQISIGVDLNQSEITKKILEVIFDENLIKETTDDLLAEKFINYLKKSKEIIFELNKHEQIYCNHVLNNPLKLIKYSTLCKVLIPFSSP